MYNTGMEENPPEKITDGRVRSGKARMEKLSPEARRELARNAAQERWKRQRISRSAGTMPPGEMGHVDDMDAIEPEVISNITSSLPIAQWPGELDIGIACYVLDDGRRIISRTGATEFLTGGKGGGNLESYTGVQTLREYIPGDLPGQMIEFVMPGVVNKTVKGMEADTFLEICRAYVTAWQHGKLDGSEAQQKIAMKAAVLSAACAKVGLTALIDEATGYQYERPGDALALKLKLFLAEEMRKWDRTFPDQLWEQFGRLTNWKGAIHSRPKYWGKLVMELIYEYLDPDVAQWLRDNAPKPKKGKNYHQWLSEQYGLKKLIEHIWKVIGVASTCDTMDELRTRMQEIYGKRPGFQFTLKLVAND
jgi:hypothetical protein